MNKEKLEGSQDEQNNTGAEASVESTAGDQSQAQAAEATSEVTNEDNTPEPKGDIEE